MRSLVLLALLTLLSIEVTASVGKRLRRSPSNPQFAPKPQESISNANIVGLVSCQGFQLKIESPLGALDEEFKQATINKMSNTEINIRYALEEDQAQVPNWIATAFEALDTKGKQPATVSASAKEGGITFSLESFSEAGYPLRRLKDSYFGFDAQRNGVAFTFNGCNAKVPRLH